MTKPPSTKELIESPPTTDLACLLMDDAFWAPIPVGGATRALLAEAGRRLLDLDCQVNLHGLGE